MDRSEYLNRRKNAFMKQHAALERKFERSVRRFFDEQNRTVVKYLSKKIASGSQLVAQDAVDALSDQDWVKRLKIISTPYVAEAVIRGVKQEQIFASMFADGGWDEDIDEMLEEAKKKRRLRNKRRNLKKLSSKFPDDFELIEGGQVAESVQQGVKKTVRLQMNQAYWDQMEETTQKWLFDSLYEGIADPSNTGIKTDLYKIVMDLSDAMGEVTRKRAKAIVRTETTTAFNGGHQAAMEALVDESSGAAALIEGKEWLATFDEDTRINHALASGQVVSVKAPFIVGGYEAMYPADVSLPPEERVNCRCTNVTAFVKDAGKPEAND